MKSRMLRRTFLRLAAASPLALASCASRTVALSESEAALESSLRRVIFAVGPWPENDLATAEDFFERFWNAVPASEAYVEDAELLRSLSERFRPGTHAAPGIDLGRLPPDERDLLVQLSDGLYNLLEIRAYVGHEPAFGVCLADRSRYMQAPDSR